MNKKFLNSIFKIIIPLFLCLSFFLISAFSIKEKTYTLDEGCHLVRGVMLLKTGDYRLNQHHPILSNVLHSIPAVLNPNLKTQGLDEEDWQLAKKDEMAKELVKLNEGAVDFSKNILYYPRLVNIFMSTVFIFVFYQILLKLFGTIPAIISSLLLAISPTFIAHSSLVTTDTPVMIFIFLSSVYVVFFVKHYDDLKKRKKFLIIFILMSFLALITKYTAIIPFLICTLFLVVYSFFRERKIIYSLKILLIILFSVFLLSFASYSFRMDTLKNATYNNTVKIQDDYKHIDILPTAPINLRKSVKHIYENVRLPMPEYIKGFYENVWKHNFYGHSSFFMGDFGKKGWLGYFPVAFSIKEPLTTVILTITSIIFSIVYFIKNKKIKPEYIILILVPTILLLLTIKSSLNLGIRHLLPIFPFIFILIGLTVNWFYGKNKKLTILTILPLIIFMYYSVLSSFPHYIEYFNESIGNKQNAYKYLRDSNLDWGQNRYLVEKYKTQNLKDGYKIIRVESLFNRDERISEEMKELQKKYHEGEVEIIDYISNTHWVIKK